MGAPKPKIHLDTTEYDDPEDPRSRRYVNAVAEFPDGSEYTYVICITDRPLDRRVAVATDIFLGVGDPASFRLAGYDPDAVFQSFSRARGRLRALVRERAGQDWRYDHRTQSDK